MTQFTRLYNNFQPEHYDIYLDINRETKQFNGRTKISGNALVNNIALHQKNLQIQSVHINEKEIPFVIDDNADLIKISTETIGQIDITVTYKATLTDTMMGIYPSYYELDGVKKQLSVHNLKQVLLVKLFQVWTNRKLKRHLIYQSSLMNNQMKQF